MDPRRARDPRLARADPRLQQPQPQPPPQLQQPPQQQLRQPLPTLTPDNGINSNPGSHSITPPQPFVTAIATVSSQIPQAADASTSASGHSQGTLSPAGFKTRPLFCVVCASNQVSDSATGPVAAAQGFDLSQNRSMEGHFVLQCARFCCISVGGLLDLS
jgi:RNA polymerase II subunit A C-terminal domain phosphatase SSU72